MKRQIEFASSILFGCKSTAVRKLRAWNHRIQHVRCRIEKILGTWKHSYSLRRMRWLGLPEATLQVRLTPIACNLKRTAVILMPIAA
jgi:transposase, IS5 family